MKYRLVLALATAVVVLSSCSKSEEYKAANDALTHYEEEINAASECFEIGEASADALGISELIFKVTDAREQKKLSVRYKKIAEKAQKKAEKFCLAE